MATKDEIRLLGSVGLFEGLTRKEVESVYRQAREVEFPEGKQILKEGETAVGFFLIVEGKASVSVRGRKRSTLGPGQFFGELALIDRGPRTATVTALTRLKTLSLVSWEFLPMLRKQPAIAAKLLLEMCRRLRAADSSPTL